MKLERLFDCLPYQFEKHPLDVALAYKEKGRYITYSTEQVLEEVNKLSNGLLALGIKPGDKVGLVSYNRPEWIFVDFAVSQIGAINVPMYPNSTSEDYTFIIQHAEIKVIFAGDLDIAAKLKIAINNIQDLSPDVYTFDEVPEVEHWSKVKLPMDSDSLTSLKVLSDQITSEDLATIIYTSGTTGDPKGVMLSHHNILSNAMSAARIFSAIRPDMKALSFLPLSHIFERTGLYAYMHKGVSIYFVQDIDTIGEHLKEVRPNIFATVPRLLEKIYEKILKKGYELKGLKRFIFFWALDLGKRYKLNENQGFWYELQLKWANKLVFSKWREALGNNVLFITSGGAALQPRLATLFWAGQIPVYEAYGMTETSPGIAFSKPDAMRIGSVGPAMENVQIKLSEDGEINVKGSNVMMGYYKRPDLTKEVIDADGWIKTGDIGEFVEEKFLKITDRKKEMFKTSGGKYIAPQILENKFKESLFIEQIMVIGENKKFPAALIVPAFDSLTKWCQLHDINLTDSVAMIQDQRVLKKFDQELEKYNANFAQYEKIKKFSLMPDPWTVETGELTAKLSMKRKTIRQKYLAHIDKIYETK
ncbi:long-chain fatty acid--CoA ligase [Fulvivirga sp. M361]|uniref:AMP-dependent synthetase/ligase n=1 Tax=Fulvivirga sp. M361 TaxID=2594266 RepID=UPI00117A0E8E|nr:long-chain fatty acid--CoA ligase [Fulvivirga sp. M361]TRX58676.1 long-chain fatty acid--CoA ligase [Fulvivirga sp. M361]